MKKTEQVQFFFRCVSFSWFVFALISIAIEFFRPSYVDYLIPLWFILLIAAVSGMISVIHKREV